MIRRPPRPTRPDTRFPYRAFFRSYRPGNRGWAKPTPRVLQTVKALADQDIHRNAAVLRLALGGVVARQRVRFGHPGGGKHAIGFPAAGLLKIIDDATGPLFAKLLIIIKVSRRVGVPDNKQPGVITPTAFGCLGPQIGYASGGHPP